MTDLVKRDPFRSIFAMPRFFEDLDDSFQRGLKVREDDENFIAEAVVAGVPAKNVDVHIEDGVLTIKAEAKEDKSNQKSSYSYYYTVALSGGQWEKADAEVENGVVRVYIPKAESARPQKIKVKEKKS